MAAHAVYPLWLLAQNALVIYQPDVYARCRPNILRTIETAAPYQQEWRVRSPKIQLARVES